METSHIAVTTAHCQPCQQQINFTTAATVATLCCHFPPSKHRVKMSALKNSANNSSSLLLLPSVPMCPLSSRGTAGRCTHELLVPPTILGFISTRSIFPQLLLLIQLHITNSSICAAVPYTTEGSSGMPQLMICLLQTILLHPNPNHPSATIPHYTM